jgi:hypothetical protein
MKISKTTIYIVGVVLTGALAGAAEATIGLVLHLQQIPQVGSIMTGVLFLVIVLGTVVFKPKNYMVFAGSAGIIALVLKSFNYFVPGVFPGACLGPAGICLFPSMSAIFMEAAAFGVIAQIFRTDYQTLPGKVSVGILASYASFLAFGLVFKPVDALFWFTVRNATIASLIAVPSISAASYLGQSLQPRVVNMIEHHPTWFLGIANIMTLGCVVSAVWV